ncbi:GNAT family N-acetyltransferase [Planosporangium thailandense]|uniref:GNAT family N-acetyltransferase n=1 Tax=Planosporangium thailandense TaxID=765197 RepID=A0ABX0XZY7_9ACTN|nr:GNAT family N-acetyltransferase [Planosporangium thailandense]NJC71641.1 GNAT family N-acetyltransferase [Planosporangium thailandense]
MTLPGISIRRATRDDAEELAALLGAAFMDDPVSGWIFESEADRRRLHPGFFRPFVDLVLAAGLGHVAGDDEGTALWLPIDVRADAPSGDPLDAAVEKAIGPEYFSRFSVLDGLMADHHPHHRDHAYLPLIGVRPDRQGTGVGTALLRHHLAVLDSAGTPAYLEASSERNAALYARHGFRRMPFTLDLPDGPSLYPMWREPAAR